MARGDKVFASDLTGWYNRINAIRRKSGINMGTITVPSVQNTKATATHMNNTVDAITALYSNSYLNYADKSAAMNKVAVGDPMNYSGVEGITARLTALEKICANCKTSTNSTDSTNSTNSTFSFSTNSTFSNDGNNGKFTFGTNVIYGTSCRVWSGQATKARFATFGTCSQNGDCATSSNNTCSTRSYKTFSTTSNSTNAVIT